MDDDDLACHATTMRSPSPSPCTQAAFEALLLPIARAFEPQLVIVFGGMDAAEGDATGNCSLSAAGAHMRMTQTSRGNGTRPRPSSTPTQPRVATTAAMHASALGRSAEEFEWESSYKTTRSVRRRSAPMPQTRAVSCTRMSTTQLKHAARRCSAVDCAGYAHMTRQLRTLAGGRLVVQLTGGYDVRSAGPPAAAVLRAMGDGHEREAGDGDGAPARARPGQSVARPAKPPLRPVLRLLPLLTPVLKPRLTLSWAVRALRSSL